METRTKQEPENYLARPQLRERGWTDGLIEKLLGEPDKRKPNPHYRSSPDMSLYLFSRIEAAEQEHQSLLDNARQKHDRRCEAAEKAVETKCRKTLQKASLRSGRQSDCLYPSWCDWLARITISDFRVGRTPGKCRKPARTATRRFWTVSA